MGVRFGNRIGQHRGEALLFVAITLIIILWLILGQARSIDAITDNWKIALTMIFGSMIGGGTSEGGGAIAFPIFTKVLGIPADQARNFTFAIQSIGMTCASVYIIGKRIPIDRKVLAVAVIPATIGGVVSVLTLAQWVPPWAIRVSFTALVAGLAIAILVKNRNSVTVYEKSTVWGSTEISLTATFGFIGGIVSGLVGIGADTLIFLLLVVLFRVSEKVATPTTVVLQACVSVACFLTQLSTNRIQPAVVDYWLAAVPVVAVGAPLGAYLCSKMSRLLIQRILLFLIALEVFTTFLIVPMSWGTKVILVAALSVIGAAAGYMSSIKKYAPLRIKPKDANSPQRSISPAI